MNHVENVLAILLSLCFIFNFGVDAFAVGGKIAIQRSLGATRIFSRKGEDDEADELLDEIAGGFIFVEKTDSEMGQFDLSKSRRVGPSPFDPPSELSSGQRTGGDGDKVIVFTMIALAFMVQFFLVSNHDAPSFDNYIPLNERNAS